MKVSPYQQGTPGWFADRAGRATASRFADVMARIKTGESAARRNYRTDLVVERLTGKPLESFTTAAMRQGTEREPDARMAYMIRTGNVVEQVGLCLHDRLECGSSPDGLIELDGGLEIKCPERSAHLVYIQAPNEPPEYRWQIQGAMWITERAWWDFVSYNPDFPERLQLIIRRVKRDDKAIAELSAEVQKFMDEVLEETEHVRNMPIAA